MNDLLANWANLDDEQRELVLLLLQEHGVDIDRLLILPQERPDGRAPLSFAQQRLWFLDLLEPGSAMYNIPSAVRLSGQLDVNALHGALNEIVRRHQILRTVFGTEKDEPVQIILPELTLPLPVVDLRPERPEDGADPDKLLAAATRLAAEEAQHVFDLVAGPLLRATLLRLADEDHVLLFNMHHIISDGWSVGVLINEVAALYPALTKSEVTSPLPPLPIQYADFAAWQRRVLVTKADGTSPLQEQIEYWRKQLAGSPPLLELPTDRPRPAVQTSRGAVQPFTLSLPASQALKRLAQAEEATPFIALLAAFQALLHRYSGQDDICVGTPVANRTRAELEPLIGFFANTLIIRARFEDATTSASPTFRELLRQVRTSVIEAQAHQDVQFEMLVEELQPQRDMSYTPLFQAMFSYQQAAPRSVQLPSLTLSPLEAHSGTAKFDLLLNVADMPAGFIGSLEYNTDLFDASTAERMIGHLQRLLEHIVAHPDQPIARLPMLTASEQQMILVEWNNTSTHDDLDMCIHTFFEAQVARAPDAIAVIFDDQRITYADLNARANQLAHYLHRAGVRPEGLVGVAMERRPELIVALLGILKAGGAYVPIDPKYPLERQSYMLATGRVSILLTHEHLAPSLPAAGPRVISVDAIWNEIAAQSGQNLGLAISPRDLAYVLFTSGSTGKPKGVAIEHRSATAMIRWAHRVYSDQEAEGVLAATSISFDLSVYEIFATLSRGGAMILAENALALPQLPAAEQVSLVNTVPSAIVVLLGMGRLPKRVRTVNLAGEPLRAQVVDQLFGIDHIEKVYDLYGPSEDTTYSTWALRQKQGPETIGRPLYNTQGYVLDRNMQPVPIGVPGELYLGGAGLARGYLHQPDMTAERFAPDPFGMAPGARLYRTGDLVKYLSDGRIVFLGRKDHQVKIRGFRIEIGEIETVLRRHPAIKEAVVLARSETDQSGEGIGPLPSNDKRLVAYLVARDGITVPSVADLRRHLLADLPEYMVPSAFVALDAMPLTPNGKVDRKALPAPGTGLITTGVTYTAPRTPTEEVLAGIWASLLGVQRVGAYDNFFMLGGHSLSATQLMSRVREAFRVELPLRSLFETPTVAGLAETIDQARQRAFGLQAPATARLPRSTAAPHLPLTPPPLSFGQQRLWFLDQLEPGSPTYNIPSAVRLHGTLNVAALQQALNGIVARHEVLRTTFPSVDGKAQQIVATELTLPLPVDDLSHLAPQKQDNQARVFAEAEAQQPFDLARGPLLRMRLLKLAADQHIALLTLHHIISDGWSSGVLVRELAALYAAFSQGEPSPLPPLALQYADYAAWQRQMLQGETLARQLDYWRQQLAGSPPLLELPTDRPRPAVQTSNGDRLVFSLAQDLVTQLRALSQQEGATLFMTLLAAYQTLLSRYAHQDDISVGTPIAGRNRQELESLIGFFVNTLVLRSDLSANPSFRELVRQVRRTTLDVFAHQDVPFEMLVDEVQPTRNLSHSPLFQVMFVFQNLPSQRIELPGLVLEGVPFDTHSAKFDLTLALNETPNGLAAAFEFNSDLFDRTTIERMVGHFRTLLEGIVADPDAPIATLPLLTQAEQQTILGAWNATDAAFDTASTLHQRFSQQASRTPDAVAVIADTLDGQLNRLTFRELDLRSTQLARHLAHCGVRPGHIVGLMIARSTDTLVGLFGILKAGAAYLPLDPSYPAERLAFMLADAAAQVIVTQAQVWAAMQQENSRSEVAFPGAQPVFLDTDWPAIAAQPYAPTWPADLAGPEYPAYVIYTSGSTGRPKGTLIAHRTALNLAAALHQVAYAHSQHERPLRISLNAPLAFDASVQQWAMLAYGHTLVVIPHELRSDAPALLAFIRRHRLDQLDCVPSQLKVLLEAGLLDPAAGWTPSIVFPGGEAIEPATWAALAAAPSTDFFNMYGPTECTVDATTANARLVPDRPTIGRPLANVRVYVLDRHQQPVPIGVPGELYIGGAGIGLGYLNRPDLTAEKFVPDPFAGETRTPYGRGDKETGGNDLPLSPSPHLPISGSRLYRTGDLVRWLPDGNLEFLGRTDFQVKVRGFRIELGEIEAVLRRHPTVKEAVVLAREDRPGDKRLVAYLVTHGDATMPSVTELRRLLLAELPEYMAPSAFVILEALPLTPNGKIDRRALPVPEIATRAELGSAFAPPATPAEQVLADIWAQVLGVERVGVHDNFFELGGDSILSIQVMARANQAGLRLTPKQLFQAPTVAALAAVAGTTAGPEAEQGPVAGPLPLTPIQHWFFEQDLSDHNHWNQSLLLATRERLEVEPLRGAVAALVTHHDALRLRFSKTAAGWEPVNAGTDSATDAAAVSYHDLAALTDSAASATIEALARQTQKGLDITHGPLFRVVYFDLGPGRPGRLLLVGHHLAVDGVSWRILLEDLQAAYQQARSGPEARINLPAKTTSFRAWAHRLAEYARSDAVLADLDTWLALGEGWLPPLPTDTDADPAENSEASAEQVSIALTVEETQALLQDVPPIYRTEINDILLTALAQTIAAWTDAPTLWVHLEGHGREELGAAESDEAATVDVSRTTGWFTTLYPVRLDLPAQGGTGAAIKAVKEQLRAVPQRGLSFGLLRYLYPDPDIRAALASLPKPEIAFNYLGQLDQTLGPDAVLFPARESAGPDRALAGRREHLLSITAGVAQSRLHIGWTYSRALHTRPTAERLAAEFAGALRGLIAHCQSPEAGGYTPSDFELAGFDQKTLDKVLKKIQR